MTKKMYESSQLYNLIRNLYIYENREYETEVDDINVYQCF
jgi:hypothetical protein